MRTRTSQRITANPIPLRDLLPQRKKSPLLALFADFEERNVRVVLRCDGINYRGYIAGGNDEVLMFKTTIETSTKVIHLAVAHISAIHEIQS